MSKKNRNKNRNKDRKGGMGKFSQKFFGGNGNRTDVTQDQANKTIEAVKQEENANDSIFNDDKVKLQDLEKELKEQVRESEESNKSEKVEGEEIMDKEMNKMMEEVKEIQNMEKDIEKDDDFVSQYGEEYKKVLQENCDMLIPTKWNMYLWAEKHPDSTIAHALKRVEKVFDFTDGGALQVGFSGGKDSTVSANLACLELNLRKLRCKYGIDREGNHRIDPLDAKWANQRITMAETDAEVVFTSTNDYSKAFLAHMGPEEIYDLGGTEYSADDVVKLSDGTKDTAKNVFNRVMNGEEIELI